MRSRVCGVVAAIVVCLASVLTAGCGLGEGQGITADYPDSKLAAAVLDDNGAKVTKLIHNGANVNGVGKRDVSLLQLAVLKDRHAAFVALLNAGADTSHHDKQGETVLHTATRTDKPEYMNELLARHLDVNVVDTDNRTPLMLAALFNTAPQMHALIAAGANLEVASANGDTALIIAAAANSFDRVLELLHAGANPLAGHRIQGKPDTTFWGFANMTPDKVLSADAKRKKAEMREFLEAHHYPVEATLPQK